MGVFPAPVRLCTVASLLALMLVAVAGRADEVVLDDLIVDGSACVGLDCEENQAFGFSTLIPKENNLRILFDGGVNDGNPCVGTCAGVCQGGPAPGSEPLSQWWWPVASLCRSAE